MTFHRAPSSCAISLLAIEKKAVLCQGCGHLQFWLGLSLLRLQKLRHAQQNKLVIVGLVRITAA